MTDGVPRFSNTFELVVVRHGQTQWNRESRFQGHADVPLDETGRAQALALRPYLSTSVFARAVSSDLVRARETAELILGDRGPRLELDPRWREMQFGTWEGLTWSEIVTRNPELAHRPAYAPRFYTPKNGESFDAVCRRVCAAVDALGASARDGTVALVVTHAGALHALLRVLLGESEAAALGVRFLPATITRFAIAPEGARIIELNRGVTETVA
jgi:broad specificity phosphatase PhoE